MTETNDDVPRALALAGVGGRAAPDAPVNAVSRPFPSPRAQNPRRMAGLLTGTIRVLLIEDNDLLRSALVSLLGAESDLTVVAAMKCRQPEVLPVARQVRPDVAVVDIGNAPAHGLPLIRELRTRQPGCQIVALVPAQPPGLVQRLLAASVLGAVSTNAPAARLLQAIRGTARSEPVIDVHLAVAALKVRPNPFTARELEVLRLAASGASGPSIARQLHLSAGTVRNYLSKAITKTQARDRFEAIRIANEAGWL